MQETERDLKREEAEVQKLFPGFRLEEEMGDADLAAMLEKGVPMRLAYQGARFDALMKAARDKAEWDPRTRKGREEIARQALRGRHIDLRK